MTGPLYGFLGQRWRTRRAWASAALVAGALCLEPFALRVAGRSYPGQSVVWPAEIAVGIAVGRLLLLCGRLVPQAGRDRASTLDRLPETGSASRLSGPAAGSTGPPQAHRLVLRWP